MPTMCQRPGAIWLFPRKTSEGMNTLKTIRIRLGFSSFFPKSKSASKKNFKLHYSSLCWFGSLSEFHCMVYAHWYSLALNESCDVLGVVFLLKFEGLYYIYRAQQVLIWTTASTVSCAQKGGVQVELNWGRQGEPWLVLPKEPFFSKKIRRETKPIEQLMPGREEELLI